MVCLCSDKGVNVLTQQSTYSNSTCKQSEERSVSRAGFPPCTLELENSNPSNAARQIVFIQGRLSFSTQCSAVLLASDHFATPAIPTLLHKSTVAQRP